MNISEKTAFFNENYDLLSLGKYGSGKKKYIGCKDPKRCRFCEEAEPTFKNESHAIPEFLGNHQLILRDECDVCNEGFSENLEDHLDKYTKPYRTFACIKGKKKIPSYKSKDKLSRISAGKDVELEFWHQPGSDMLSNETQSSMKVKFDFESHIPVAVYKALVKIALSLIEDQKELAAFQITIKWLLDADHSRPFMLPLEMLTTYIPGFQPIDSLFAILLRRKEGKSVPYAILVIGFGNWIYQIHVPSHLEGQSFTYPLYYYPIPEIEKLKAGELQSERIDLSSSEKKPSSKTMILHFRQ